MNSMCSWLLPLGLFYESVPKSKQVIQQSHHRVTHELRFLF